MMRLLTPLMVMPLLVVLLVALDGASAQRPAIASQVSLGALRHAAYLDSELMGASLRARYSQEGSYDALVQIRARYLSLLEQLEAPDGPLLGLDQPSIDAGTRAFVTLGRRKVQAVEDLKSHNAILRNSLAYLPQLTERLAEHLPLNHPARVIPLRTALLAWRFAQHPTDALETELAASRRALEALGPSLAPDAQVLLHRLGQHLGAITANARSVEIDLAVIQDPASHETLMALNKTVEETHAQAFARTRTFYTLLFYVSLGILALGGLALWHGARSLFEIKERHSGLQARLAERSTALQLQSEALIATRAQVEQVNRSKSDFLANLSHELRTPLNGVLGMTELALEKATEAPVRECLAQVLKSGGTLLTLLNDLIRLAESKDALEGPQLRPVVVAHLLKEPLSGWEEACAAQGLRLHVDLDGARGGRAGLGDPDRMVQILGHLMDNALKFTPRGGQIALACHRDPGALGHPMLRITLRDTGIGIPQHRLSQVFEVFEQADGSKTREHGGMGLGLALTTSAVTQLGGEIWLESSLGSGTAVFVSLPFPDAPAAMDAPPSAPLTPDVPSTPEIDPLHA